MGEHQVFGSDRPSAGRDRPTGLAGDRQADPGGGARFVAGIQYAPSDNVKIAGNAAGTGIVGAIIAWTIEYDSGFLNQESAASNEVGVLRLDRACSPGEICNP